MTDYKAMYFSLFNTITDAIELLKKAQQNGERMYIENEDIMPAIYKSSEQEETTA